MALKSSGFLSEAILEKTNEKLEAAIEDLRVKYEKKAQEEAAAKAAAEKEAKACASCAAGDTKPAEPSMVMEDSDLEALRKSRIEALKKAAASRKGHKDAGHGELRTIVEDEFLKEVTSTEFVLVHFFHPEFETCKVMDKHLRICAARPEALGTKFLRLEAPKAPFFVAKLKVKVLPSLLFFHNGVVTGRLTGFEGLRTLAPASLMTATGGAGSASASSLAAGTDFTTGSLLRMLKLSGVLGKKAEESAEEGDDDLSDGDDDGDLSKPRSAAAMADARRRMMEKLEAGLGDDE